MTTDTGNSDRYMIASGVSLRSHLIFTTLSATLLVLLFSLMRLALLLYNRDLIGETPVSTFVTAFGTGLHFDLRAVAFALLPLLLAMVNVRLMALRGLFHIWLSAFASVVLFLGALELDFYREFHQRLNGLVFQYLGEDPTTVVSMLWHGFPIARYLVAWALATLLIVYVLRGCDRLTRSCIKLPVRLSKGGGIKSALVNEPGANDPAADTLTVNSSPARNSSINKSLITRKCNGHVLRWNLRLPLIAVCLFGAAIGARGTVREGPPLRWGDAFVTDSPFANQLALNGLMTLANAATHHWSSSRDSIWQGKLSTDLALESVRDMLLTSEDHPVDSDQAAVRRVLHPNAAGALPIRNVVIILMESFAGRYVGALGSDDGITPYFDQLAEQGLLFTNGFSNGTHTHQGMFATMACFPNLPGFEYLMQQPEGLNQFSGLPQLLSVQGFDNMYVYNGDFAWDNQQGFFANQGMTRFIGRSDFVNPAFSDPTWGVSDQDMFDRALEEMTNRDSDLPYYALLQTLSNHTPYALPDPLPIEQVTGHGALDDHLTAMRYSDWALGRFFAEARNLPNFDETLFVILGDHGFSNPEQLTDIDLNRFHVPILFIGPGVQELFGRRNNITATQVDVVPTIMGRFGKPVQHQCWGRDLLSVPEGDPGVGVIKPSGGDQTVAIISGRKILVEPKGQKSRLYDFQLGSSRAVQVVEDEEQNEALREQLHAFLQISTQSLLNNQVGAVSPD